MPLIAGRLVILRHILKNMNATFSTQIGHLRRFYPIFANCVHATLASMFTVVNVKFCDQTVASLPKNPPETVRFLKSSSFGSFLKK